MNQEEKFLVFLAMQEDLSSSKINSLLFKFNKPSILYNLFESKSNLLNDFLKQSEIEKISNKCTNENLNSYIKNLEKKQINYISRFSDNISKKVLDLFELCNLFGLFYKGDISLLNTKCLAVVGTRMPDVYGRKTTEDFSTICAKAGITIVSGLASGVDSIAHNAAFNCNGKTIAVLGGGFDHIYPAYNTQLAQKVAECGLLLSEYAPNIKPNAFHFPVRNRIIAGISSGVLITQMGEKSGAMHTKNYAIEYGKNLYVLVCDCYKESHKGNLATIEEMPFVATVSPSRILLDYGISLKESQKKNYQLSLEEQLIVNYLKDGEKHYDEIVMHTKLSPQTVNSLLTTLKISGIINQSAGNFFSL